MHITSTVASGGAGIAAKRLSRMLVKAGISSDVFVARGRDSEEVYLPYPFPQSLISPKYRAKIRGLASRLLGMLDGGGSYGLRSYNVIPSGLVGFINASEYDIVHMHWFQGELMSIEDIGMLRKPIVFTLHDYWLIQGCRHLPERNENVLRRSIKERCLDLDGWTRRRKRRVLPKPCFIHAPSKHMAESAKSSDVIVERLFMIPHPIDTRQFCPRSVDSDSRQTEYVVEKRGDENLWLFSSAFGTSDMNKGWERLLKALGELKTCKELRILLVGKMDKAEEGRLSNGIRIEVLGEVSSMDMQMVYNSSDLVIMPSYFESYGLTAAEAIACGCPVVAYEASGIDGIIENGFNGVLVDSVKPSALARRLQDIIDDPTVLERIRENCASYAERYWSEEVLTEKYIEMYTLILEEWHQNGA